jgi:predicted ferric reductase/Ca2+-binding EF-hand superfamily protein
MFGFKQRRQIHRAFFRIAGNDKMIDYPEWKEALGLKNNVLSKRMFELADEDGSGYIDKKEFYKFARTLLKKGSNERLRFVFRTCDMNGDQFIATDEMYTVIHSSLDEQGLRLPEDKIQELVDCFYESAKVKRKSGINEPEFLEVLEGAQGVESQFDGFISKLLDIAIKRKPKRVKAAGMFTRIKRNIAHNWKGGFWFLLWLASNAFLFAHAMLTYAEAGSNLAVQIARGGGACLNFNCALVLLPMCRSICTWLRHTFFYRLLPLDSLTDIHKTLAFAICGFSLVHIAAHFYNYWLNQLPILHQLGYTVVGATGAGLSVILILMLNTSLQRQKNYERFLRIHLLYAPFMVALLFHGPVFWKWLAPALAIFGLDALYRIFFKYRKVEITELRSLSDRVTQVRFKRGTIFPFYPGDYVKIRIPAIAWMQWHPFTLSAAPQSSRLDVHVRNNGDWSGALHNLANIAHPQRKKWTAYLDGPYGAPTSSIYRSQVAVLIAGGIGVTPFASVLQSLLLKEKASTVEQQQIIHFHWLNRSQLSYEWFIELMQKAEEQMGQSRFFLNIHLTSLARNLSNLVMQLAFESYFQKHGVDPITHLKARTSAGRPNWDVIFSELSDVHKGKRVDIYFCGPKPLGADIRKFASKHGLYYFEEKFE